MLTILRKQCYALSQGDNTLLHVGKTLTYRTLLLSVVLGFANVAVAQSDVKAVTPKQSFDQKLFPTETAVQVPQGYLSQVHSNVRWIFPVNARKDVVALKKLGMRTWGRLAEILGTPLETELTVFAVRNIDEMRRYAPQGYDPPLYANGFAAPAHGVVYLSFTNPGSWEVSDIRTVLVHELAHVALYRATGMEHIPRWFSEGFAVHFADESTFTRNRALWEATVRGRLLSMQELEHDFPSKQHQTNLAYAQSASFFSYLMAEHGGNAGLRQFLKLVKNGVAFHEAVISVYDAPVDYLEREWRRDLAKRYRTLPLLLSGGTIWVLASLLIVLAFVRRRKRIRQQREEEEDFDWESVEVSLYRQETDSQETHQVPLVASGNTAETNIPKIEIDGKDHTLH